MTIVRWSPFMELGMPRQLGRLLELGGIASALPPTDVYETDDDYVVEVDVPGFEEKELTVEVTDHRLAIRGRRERTTDETTKEFTLHERIEREFEREFVLPAEADTEHLVATFGKGVLEVHAPKLAAAKAKQVTISTS